jgi:UDP:flavonoid glycosyltransferase YjiC (YdhE family)
MWTYWKEFLLGTVPAQLSDLETVLREWTPEAIVCDISMLAPILVLHEARGVPVAVLSHLGHTILRGSEHAGRGATGLKPRGLMFSSLRGLARKIADLLTVDVPGRVGRLRLLHGLPPGRVRIVEMIARMPLFLVPGAVELDYYYKDLPDSVRYVGPCLWPPIAGELPSSRAVGQPPSILVDEGTLFPPELKLLRAAVHGLGGLPVEATVLAGKGRDLSGLGVDNPPGNVNLQPWQAPALLAGPFEVFVTTGNTDSVMFALSRGIPLVVVPSTIDQDEMARRVEDSGAGVRLAEALCTPKSLRRAVEQVLSDSSFRTHAQRLAGALAAYGGPRKAAGLLTELACGRRGTST